MLATADCTNHYAGQIIYESEWTENIPAGVPWLNLLTAEPIPEEIDDSDTPCSSVRNNSASNCSSSSTESCYVVLEIQRPRSTDITSSKVDDDEEEEEEVEEIEEEIEELNFAQIKYDDHNVNYEQFAISMTTEVPIEEHAVEHQQKQVLDIEEYAKVTEPVIYETENDILFHKAKNLSRFTKRMKAMSSVSTREQNYSTSSDDESLKITKLKTIRKNNEYHPTVISAVAAEQQLNFSRYSTPSLDSIDNKYSPVSPSLDSIDNKYSPVSPIRTRITTTFSNISFQRPPNPIQIQRPSPTMGIKTLTLTRTFAFDRACMEKYGRIQEKETESINIQTKPVSETIIKKQIELPPKKTEQMKPPAPPPPPPPSNDSLNYRSFTNTIQTSSCTGSGEGTTDELEMEHRPSTPRSTFISTNFSKTSSSSILCSMKKYARTVVSEYRSSFNNNKYLSTEPKLLEVKYLDGRLPLRDDEAREAFQRSQTLSGSISNRLHRPNLSKMSSVQDLSTQTTSFHNSYRKRILNRFRTLIENNSIESSQLPQSRPWQHKSISELYNEKKHEVNRQR